MFMTFQIQPQSGKGGSSIQTLAELRAFTKNVAIPELERLDKLLEEIEQQEREADRLSKSCVSRRWPRSKYD